MRLLTPAQERIVRELADGRYVSEIAKKFGIAPATVYCQLGYARDRMNARTTAHLVALWLRAKREAA